MADVTPRRRDRAQLIIISGLLIAVTLLVLVLLLNTVIYTENVATRGIDADASEASSYEQVLNEEIQRILAAEHGHGEAENWGDLDANVSSAIDHLLAQQANVSIERGRVAKSDVTLHRGVYVDAVDVQENATWVTGVEETSVFNLTVHEDDLANGTHYSESLNVSINDHEWSLIVNGTGDGVELLDENGERLCDEETFAGELTVDFINETVNDVSCGGDLWGADGVPPDAPDPFDIHLNLNGDLDAAPDLEVFAGGDNVGSEFEQSSPAVFEAQVDLSYRSAKLTYETRFVIEGAPP